MRRFLALVALVLVAGCVAGSGTVLEPQVPELVAAGEELYAANCAECHGSDLRGTDKGPSHLSIIYEPAHHADGSFIFAIQRGSRAHHWNFGDMPPIEGLDMEEIQAIVAFVREKQRLEGFEE